MASPGDTKVGYAPTGGDAAVVIAIVAENAVGADEPYADATARSGALRGVTAPAAILRIKP